MELENYIFNLWKKEKYIFFGCWRDESILVLLVILYIVGRFELEKILVECCLLFFILNVGRVIVRDCWIGMMIFRGIIFFKVLNLVVILIILDFGCFLWKYSLMKWLVKLVNWMNILCFLLFWLKFFCVFCRIFVVVFFLVGIVDFEIVVIIYSFCWGNWCRIEVIKFLIICIVFLFWW